MEKAVSGQKNEMHLDYTVDVISMMTEIRKIIGLILSGRTRKIKQRQHLFLCHALSQGGSFTAASYRKILLLHMSIH
ncbi:MAG: hypothetical protein ACLUUG_12810 [Lachnospiraceae bacterium]